MMENKEPKSSKAIMTFGILIITSGIVGAFLLLLSTKRPELYDSAMWAWAIVCILGVFFQIYLKEFRVGQEKWMTMPLPFRFVWWFIFCMNTFFFALQAWQTFIL